MNRNKDVVVFTLVATFILLCYSLYATLSHNGFWHLNKVSIVADVFTGGKNQQSELYPVYIDTPLTSIAADDLTDTLPETGNRELRKYRAPKTITAFCKDTSTPSLPLLMRKLIALKHGRKGKIRIAWFGDSMIEGDLLSQTFRKQMQRYFGGYGVGFIPANAVTAAYRTTAAHTWTGDWREESFKTTTLTAPLFLSGHTFFTGDGTITVKDATFKDTGRQIEKCLICGSTPGMVKIIVNGQAKQYVADKKVNRLLLDTDSDYTINVAIQNDKLPVYGVSLEPETGIVVDNFSFRGITGLELGKLDTGLLHALDTIDAYDLVILEYGANLMFRPEDLDYTWYQKHIIPVVRKLRKAMPHTEFLVISTADRAFRYDDSWKTAVGIDNLVKIQAELAYDNNAAFYNMYASMGGAGTIVKWADTIPAYANKDYIHPNQRGAELLGNMLFDSFMEDYRKANTPK